MKTINIKGKDYITVNERLIYFRSQERFEGWQISETIVSIDDKEGIFKVIILNHEGFEIASAHAQEYRDEVQNSVKNQTTAPKDDKKWLTEAQLNATLKATKDQAEKVLNTFKMKKEYKDKIVSKFNLK